MRSRTRQRRLRAVIGFPISPMVPRRAAPVPSDAACATRAPLAAGRGAFFFSVKAGSLPKLPRGLLRRQPGVSRSLVSIMAPSWYRSPRPWQQAGEEGLGRGRRWHQCFLAACFSAAAVASWSTAESSAGNRSGKAPPLARAAIVPEPQFAIHIEEHACRKPPHL